jgi:hypothetical protein
MLLVRGQGMLQQILDAEAAQLRIRDTPVGAEPPRDPPDRQPV